MTNQYIKLIDKLDSFIKKYYKNKILKGILISLSLYLVLFLTITVSEYFVHFNILIRTIIFYSAIIASLLIFVEFIAFPAFKLIRIGKIISYKDASGIIANYFTDIKDKLYNILELANQTETSQNKLVLASIDQKIGTLTPFNFVEVIDYKKSLNYLKYLAIPVLLLLYLSIFKSNIISNGTERIINHNTFYEPETPFKFDLQNDSLAIRKGQDFKLKLNIEGDYIPSEISINYNNNVFLLSKKDNFSKKEFIYNLKNVNNSFDFYFEADGYKSKKYSIDVLPTPLILKFYVDVIPPDYIGEVPKKYSNVGDLTVPYGSRITWNFETKDINSLDIRLLDSLLLDTEKQEDNFVISKQFLKSSNYDIIVSNDFFKDEELVNYKVVVVPDLYPEININKLQDSLNLSEFYYKGLISDDYGFYSLSFNYAVSKGKDEKLSYKSVNIPIQKSNSSQDFYYFYDFSELKIKNGEAIKYYFQIRDNDAISGFKSTRSEIYEFTQLSLNKLDSLTEQSNKNVQSKVNQATELSNQIQKDLEKFQEKSLNEKMSEWEKTNFIDQLLQKQKNLDDLISDIKKENEQKNNQLNNFTEQKEEIIKKQEDIQKLLDELITDEMRELLEELKKLQEEFDDKKIDEILDELKFDYDELSENLDKDLEILKQMEVEEKINSTIEQLDQLADEQKELSEESKDKKSDKDELAKKQNENKEEFEKLMEEYEEAIEKNKDLEEPMDLDEFNEEKKEISEDMENTEEMMQKSKMSKASKSQSKTSQDMKKMSEQMQSMMEGNSQEQNSESIEEVRQILSNLTDFSFSQEEIYSETQEAYSNSPKFNELKIRQLQLKSDFKVIEDSLYELARRNPQINQPVSTEISEIKKNLEKSLENLEKRSKNNASVQQRNVMTSANNLSLLLNEILAQMQAQGSGSGGGDCKKPGGKGKPSMSDMKGQQQKMQDQLEQMIQDMKDGKQDGENGENGKTGKNGKNGKSQSQQLAEQLAQQEMFEKMMQDMMSGNAYKPETVKELNEIKQLNEDIKKDILNNNITQETLIRQKEILTRLLEAEESEDERKFEDKRESNQAKNIAKKNPKDIQEKFNNKNSYSENMNRNSLKLQNFYKQHYDSYLQFLNN